MKRSFFILFISFLFIKCDSSVASVSNSDHSAYADNKTSISETEVFTNLFVDSAMVEQYIKEQDVDNSTAKRIREFYQNREYQFAWFTEDGLAEQAQSFWNLHAQYVNASKDNALRDKDLHEKMERLLEDETYTPSKEEMIKTELELTHHFFDYAKYAYTGKTNPSDLQWHIPKRKIDAVALLDSLVTNKGRNIKDWEPVNARYNHLQEKVLQYHELEKKHDWKKIDLGDKKVLRKDDSAAVVTELKDRLQIFGDLRSRNTSPIYDREMVRAVEAYQKRHGLKIDGVVGPQVMGSINTPLEERIEQMLINMERMRWLPEQSEGRRIMVNIPEYKAYVYEGQKKVMEMDIVVGKAANRTVVFSDIVEYVVFAPYWNIPRSITRNEILPSMEKNPNYLQENNMEITDRRNGLPVIRQKPGADNSLGRVKFIFPNRYNIYLHDTPAKSLFDQTKRAFSHGCIRVSKPAELAEYLLQDQNWSSSRIRNAMYADSEKWVKLEDKVPVAIAYFTSWVDEDGTLNFREDIYGHDDRMEKRLFAHSGH